MEVKSISDIKSLDQFKDSIEHRQYLLQIYREYINKLSNLAELATEYRLITSKVLDKISMYEDDISNNEIIVNYNIIDEDNQIEQLDIELNSEVKPKAKLTKASKKVTTESVDEPTVVEEKPKAKSAKTTKKVITESVESVEPVADVVPKAKSAKTTKKVTTEEVVVEPIVEEKPKAKLAKTTKKVISDPT